MEDDGIGYSGLQRHHTPPELGCRLGQGILLSKPFQAEQLDNLLKAAGSICSRPREPWPAKPPQREQ
jgi:hypothetical protein